MLTNRTLTEQQTLIRRYFIDFFESERNEEKYYARIQTMIHENKARLLMDMGDLLDFVPPNMAALAEMSSDYRSPIAATSGAINNHTAAPSLGAGILAEPGHYIPLLELALHDVVLRQQPEYLKVDYRTRAVHVGFDGPVGTVLSPRELYARHLNTLVALEGIVTRQSNNRPRVVETVHYCPETNKFTRREFRDQLTPMLDSAHLPTVNVLPKNDMDGHALRTELGLCTFIDSQCAVLQETPERAPTGQLPRHVELRFDDDLVDAVKPGDRVVLVGMYMPYTSADYGKGFHTIVLVNHVVQTQAYAHFTRHVPAVEERLRQFAQRCMCSGSEADGVRGDGVLQTLVHAIAPSIHGLMHEKAAILLMMVGGVERQAHSTHIRGDINVLLVGEPSTAKSQLLRFVLGVSPLALNTTGKGSSGVGLTAAVTVDSYSGERSLSAGAMVLADRGILCVDEFDKMSAQDRVAMHEAMEQQTVTIAKAGIHASLNARCSVLAAANPIYGFYSVQHKLSFNVGLPESLLSRFDLTFIILDQHSSEYSRRIGSHILHNHMTAQPVGFDPSVVRTIVDSAESGWATRILGNTSSTINGNSGNSSSSSGSNIHDVPMPSSNSADALASSTVLPSSTHAFMDRPKDGMSSNSRTGNYRNKRANSIHAVSADFLRAYIQMAKQGAPLLTEAAQQLVSQHYVQLRAEQHESPDHKDAFFVTARTLEAIVRLSTAHAKLRLSSVVEECDVGVAMRLLRASVHAAATALESRQVDNAATLAPAREEDGMIAIVPAMAGGKRSAAAATAAGSTATTAAGDDSAATASSHTLQRVRRESDSDAAGASSASGDTSAVILAESAETRMPPGASLQTVQQQQQSHMQRSAHTSRAVIDALKSFRREQRSSLTLRELHTCVNGITPTAIMELRRVVHEMQGDAFVVEDGDEDDTIQLL